MSTARAIQSCFESADVPSASMNAANVVDVLAVLAQATHRVSTAIMPANASYGTDATGGHVESLTEAVMGMTQGLSNIADAIRDLAEAVREHGGTA